MVIVLVWDIVCYGTDKLTTHVNITWYMYTNWEYAVLTLHCYAFPQSHNSCSIYIRYNFSWSSLNSSIAEINRFKSYSTQAHQLCFFFKSSKSIYILNHRYQNIRKFHQYLFDLLRCANMNKLKLFCKPKFCLLMAMFLWVGAITTSSIYRRDVYLQHLLNCDCCMSPFSVLTVTYTGICGIQLLPCKFKIIYMKLLDC